LPLKSLIKMIKTRIFLAVPLLVAAINLFVGCEKRDDESESPVPEHEETVITESPADEAWRNSEPYQKLSERLKSKAISPARVREEHEKRFLQPIPNYVQDIRGIMGKFQTSGTYPAYVFEVPVDHIADFDEYLVELGVPREYLYEDVNIHNPLTHRIPRSSTNELEFCETAQLHPNGQETMGIYFDSDDEWMGYSFVKKWNERYFSIYFSRDTGEVQFIEGSSDEDD